MIKRTTIPLVKETLADYNKMAFVSGPRQIGKTTLAASCRKLYHQSLYFNWDIITDQKKLTRDFYFFEKENRNPDEPFLLIFDEIHKYARWKNYLKGAYDRFKDEFHFIITGSGRLVLYKKGGDSLLGRYMSIPMFPFTVGELSGNKIDYNLFKRMLINLPDKKSHRGNTYSQLFEFSGFPEPFCRGKKRFYNQWFQERKTLILREDIRDAHNIREISLLEMLSHLIPERVGSPLSINALREDIGVAFETIRDWILILENFFYVFRITPFTGNLNRTLKKETKVYLYDWVEVQESGYRFENLVAVHLKKSVETWRTAGEGDIHLHYLRDREKREVDFVIVEKKKPVCLIECKTSDDEISSSLVYYQQKLNVPVAVQLVHKSGICKKMKKNNRIQWIVSADRWLGILP